MAWSPLLGPMMVRHWRGWPISLLLVVRHRLFHGRPAAPGVLRIIA